MLPSQLYGATPLLEAGSRYQDCVAHTLSDPAGTLAKARGWAATGGGAPAQHCVALAQIRSGSPEAGAATLGALAERFRRERPDLVPDLLGQQAQAWEQAGNPERALTSLGEAIRLRPDDGDLRVDRAVLLGSLGRFATALPDLDAALAANPERVDALVLRGTARARVKDLDGARADLDHAIERDPHAADAFAERGAVRHQTQDEAGAKADWEMAARLDPQGDAGRAARRNLDQLAGKAPPAR